MPDSATVLIGDDEPQIRRFLRITLEAHNYTVIEAANGKDTVARCAADNPDVVILDLGLPDMDGIDVIRKLREWTSTPIIVLSVRAKETDKVVALDSGADDYVNKPFGMGELLARVRTALRHKLHTAGERALFAVGDLSIDLVKRAVKLGGQDVRLSRKEYDLLRYLVAHAGRVLTHQQLLREVWGAAHIHDNHYLRVYVGHLRHKLETDPARPIYILTEPGVGYRFADAEDLIRAGEEGDGSNA